MSASAFKASYSDWRLVKTRGVVQIIVEVPLAEADAAYEILGGMPDPAHERWVALAALQSAATQPERKDSVSTARAKRPWMELQPQQQAGIRCGEEAFKTFLREEYENEWRESQDAAECVRLICDVQSRVQLGINQKARMLWRALDDKFEAWKRVA